MLSASKLLVLPGFLFFSFIASWYDVREKRIPNWLILRALLFGFGISLVYLIFFDDLFSFLYFVFISFAVSFFLYFFDFWCAGDVKFVFALSLLSPPLAKNPFFPITLSVILIAFFSFFHSLLHSQVKFKPKFNLGIIFPLALFPLFSFFSGFLSFFFTLALILLSEKILNRRGKKIFFVFLALSIFNFFVFPRKFLKFLIMALLASLITSFKAEGTIPSAPIIAVSFIYSLLFTVP